MSSELEHRSLRKPAAWLVGLCLLIVYIVWGTTYFAIKVAIEGIAPFFLVGTRFVVAGVLLLGWQALRGAPLPTLRQWGGAAVVGFLLLVVGNGAVSVAEHWVSSGATVALISIMPLATALWSGAFGDWPRRAEWIAIALGGAGAAVMLLGRDLQGSIAGTLLILLATVSWSLGSVLSRRLDIPHGPTGFGAEMLTAGLMGLAVSAALGEHWAIPHVAHIWWAWGYLVVFGALIAFSAYRFVVERVSASLAATYAYVNPPVALAVGWWLGNESFSANVLVGLPVVLGAVALHAWLQTRDAPKIPAKVSLDTASILPSQARSKP
ncbi:MAG TPA: EamA family transporter [Steroidobacteraceae bacterium]|jgi:drug/metabolite transporter (DMT)-like permease